MPERRILCWVWLVSRRLMVSPSATPRTRPLKFSAWVWAQSASSTTKSSFIRRARADADQVYMRHPLGIFLVLKAALLQFSKKSSLKNLHISKKTSKSINSAFLAGPLRSTCFFTRQICTRHMAQHRPQAMAQAERQGLGLREVCPGGVCSTPVSGHQDKGAKHAV